MEQIVGGNTAQLVGEALSDLEFSHKTYGETFYLMTLGVLRKSGYEDKIRLMISERIICNNQLDYGQSIKVIGQIRTYNEDCGGKNKLNIVVFVKELECFSKEAEIPHENSVCLQGFVCKKPVRRTSPLGREICDLMMAVNRMYNKSDYVPCIAWGRNAVYGETFTVGASLLVEGRIQSREYKKRDEAGNEEYKTAYEVSVLKMEER
ncbi:MAG: single-stranded DNA-binding protein [Anaerovoracaceae bacterium]